jgi:hypothetical protein
MNHPDVVEQPGNNGEAKAWCPWHNDRSGGKPSLGINVKKQIVKCWTGCEGGYVELAKAWGIDLNTDTPSQQRAVLRTHNYNNPDGTLRFQSVKFTDSTWILRRPDPNDPDRWFWNMKSTQPVLYRLDELRDANPEEWVFIVEGEKDVDRLVALGFVATTNAMGAGKWHADYNKELKGRKVAIIPDNDKAGKDHAAKVARAIYEIAETVKVLTLAGMPEKGDISDWFDASHTPDDLNTLLAHSPSYTPPTDGEETDDEHPEWKINPQRLDALKVTEQLHNHGFFVNGGLAGAFFFNERAKQLIEINKDDIEFKSLISDQYQINPKDQLYGVLLEHLLVEAHQRGHHSVLRRFGYHDRPDNMVLLDMGKGQVLKITPDSIEVCYNGADGVLFQKTYDADPWEYEANALASILYKTLIAPVNFSADGPLDIRHQKLLFMLWMLSFAFESSMPFKAMALAVGPNGSGKSVLFRIVGKALIGSGFDVTSIGQDSKGEEDFMTSVTNSAFVTIDNVDQFIRWLPNKLANVVGGVQMKKRKYFTPNQMETFESHCMLAVTARTPTVSLRREDVAERTLVFTVGHLVKKIAETKIYENIAGLRNQLMSDYAKIIQKALKIPLDDVKVADEDLRLADFAEVITRIGMGMGPETAELTDETILKIKASQHQFATEEDSVVSLLEIWIARTKPSKGEQLDLGAEPNNGRKVLAEDLVKELQAIAKEYGTKMNLTSAQKLGRWITNMRRALSETYEIEKGRVTGGMWWSFKIREDQPEDVSQEEQDTEDYTE